MARTNARPGLQKRDLPDHAISAYIGLSANVAEIFDRTQTETLAREM